MRKKVIALAVAAMISGGAFADTLNASATLPASTAGSPTGVSQTGVVSYDIQNPQSGVTTTFTYNLVTSAWSVPVGSTWVATAPGQFVDTAPTAGATLSLNPPTFAPPLNAPVGAPVLDPAAPVSSTAFTSPTNSSVLGAASTVSGSTISTAQETQAYAPAPNPVTYGMTFADASPPVVGGTAPISSSTTPTSLQGPAGTFATNNVTVTSAQGPVTTGSYTVSGTDPTNLTVQGSRASLSNTGLSFSGIGGTASADPVSGNITANAVLTGTTFSVDAATGNTVVGGALSVGGASTLTGQLNANGGIVTNNANINAGSGTISTTGAVNAGSAHVTGVTTLDGQLNANGGIVTNNANINAGSGTISTTGAVNAGSAHVTGVTTLDGQLNANGGIVTNNANINAGSGTISTTGAVNAGTLDVSGVTTLGGAATINNSLAVDTNGAIANTTGTSVLSVANNAVSLGVTNAGGHLNGIAASTTETVLRGGTASTTLTLNNGGMTVADTTNGTTFTVNSNGDAAVTRDASVGRDLSVTGATTLTGALAANGGATVKGGLTVATGTTNVGALNAGVTTTTGITNTGTLQNNGAATVTGNFTASSNAYLGGTTASNAALVVTPTSVTYNTNANMNGNKITGLANGTSINDAVNYGQLMDVRKEARRGAANAAALAGLPALEAGKQYNFGVGIGSYKGESALSIGGHARINADTTAKFGVGFTGGDAAVSAGIGWSF
jgi:hypothetical protein